MTTEKTAIETLERAIAEIIIVRPEPALIDAYEQVRSEIESLHAEIRRAHATIKDLKNLNIDLMNANEKPESKQLDVFFR